MNNSHHQYYSPVWTSGRYDKISHSAIIYNLATGKSYFFEDLSADVVGYMLIAGRNKRIDISRRKQRGTSAPLQQLVKRNNSTDPK